MASAAGVLSLDTDAIDFDGRAPGTASDAEGIFVLNEGPDPVTIDSIELTGPGGAQFELSYEDCTFAPLAPDEECLIAVSFAPTTDGDFIARVDIGSDASNAPHSVGLTGWASSDRILSLSTTEIDFGVVERYNGSRADVWAQNEGVVPVTVSTVRLSGDPAFRLEQDECSGAILQPGERCNLGVGFVPSRIGEHTGTLIMQSNAGGGTHEIRVTGDGTGRHLNFEPAVVDFGSNAQPGAFRDVRLVNRGRSTQSVAISLLDDAGGAFRIERSSCGAELSPSASCVVRVSFRPHWFGRKRGTLVAREPSGAFASFADLIAIRPSPKPAPFRRGVDPLVLALVRTQIEGNLRSMLQDARQHWPGRRKRTYVRRGFALPAFRISHFGELTVTIKRGRSLVAAASARIVPTKARKVVARTTKFGRRLLGRGRPTRLRVALRFRGTNGFAEGVVREMSAPFVLRR
jgi:hypothetical protein